MKDGKKKEENGMKRKLRKKGEEKKRKKQRKKGKNGREMMVSTGCSTGLPSRWGKYKVQ